MSKQTDIEPLVVSPNEAMRLLHCSRDRLYEFLNSGELASYCDGRLRKITMQSVKDLVARKVAEAPSFKPRPGQPWRSGRCGGDARASDRDGADQAAQATIRSATPAGYQRPDQTSTNEGEQDFAGRNVKTDKNTAKVKAKGGEATPADAT